MGHNHTAFAPEDVEDARRGAPATSLQPWGEGRRLEFLGSSFVSAFLTALPAYDDYIFNVCRGEMRPGRFGMVAHLLEELPATDGQIDGGGTFYGTRVTTKRGLGSFFGFEKERPQEPFAANAAWAPTTAAILRVPELALQPRVTLEVESGFLNFGGGRDLGPAGVPGWRLHASDWVSDELAAAVTGAARPLAGLGATWGRVLLDHGRLAVIRNGFVADAGSLDHLVATAVAVADALVATAPLPAGTPPWCQPMEHETAAFREGAGQFGMALADPVDLHRTHRHLPFPGRAHGLLTGPLPGSSATGHLAFAVQGGRTSGTYRTVVIAPAAPGAATPLGGTVHKPTDQYVEVADGLAVSWPRVRSVGRLEAVEKSAAGVTTLRDLGLAAL
ncbi:MAG: hypothetical protein JNK12_25075 [Acidimicrobiales bacterium]|nr:hypothetical protein [Acidimicrobiales bacterium]